MSREMREELAPEQLTPVAGEVERELVAR